MLGTPNESTWPGVTSLPDWNVDFPVWPTLSLQKFYSAASDEVSSFIHWSRFCLSSYLTYLF